MSLDWIEAEFYQVLDYNWIPVMTGKGNIFLSYDIINFTNVVLVLMANTFSEWKRKWEKDWESDWTTNLKPTM